MSIRFSLATFAGKSSQALLRLSGSGATALPGLITHRLAPEALHHFAQACSEGVVLVSGTNGKTTTCRLLAQLLQDRYPQLVHNASGSNMSRGHLSAFLGKASWNGKISAKLALLEVDEAVLPETLRLTQPRALLLLNLFRDQLDRYGEVDAIQRKWLSAIQKYLPKTAWLVVNADDPNLVFLAQQSQHPQILYYGLEDERVATSTKVSSVDAYLSPVSGQPLVYTAYYLSHLGKYVDPNSSFRRPTPSVSAKEISLAATHSTFTIDLTRQTPSTALSLRLPLPGIYNIYNALAASALSSTLPVDTSKIPDRFGQLRGVFGRFETVEVLGHTLTLCLIKNPAGAAEVLRTLTQDPAQRITLTLIANDRFADGQDVSWYWDTPFELVTGQTQQLICSGNRAQDMALRLKYAGYTGPTFIEPTPAAALQTLIHSSLYPTHTHYVLTTYTATMEVQKIIRQLGWKTKAWHQS